MWLVYIDLCVTSRVIAPFNHSAVSVGIRISCVLLSSVRNNNYVCVCVCVSVQSS